MTIWVTPININILNQRSLGTLAEHLEIEFVKVKHNALIARMPVNHKTKQPLGLLHGGASCALAETVGSMAANFCVDYKTHYCVGLEINANHLKSAREGFVFAETTPLHRGRSTQVWHIDIHDEAHRHICIARLTLAVICRDRQV